MNATAVIGINPLNRATYIQDGVHPSELLGVTVKA